MKTSLLSLLALAGTLSAGVAQADNEYYYYRPHTHEGMQLRLTMGAGYLTDNESVGGVWQDYISGGGGIASLYLGGSLVPGLFLGGFITDTLVQGPAVDNGNQVFYTAQNIHLNTWSVGPYVDVYPNPHGGFHLLGGVGYSEMGVDNPHTYAFVSGNGFSVQTALGYDWWLNRTATMGFLLSLTHTQAMVDSSLESVWVPGLSLSISYH